jgi:hypothetical protein
MRDGIPNTLPVPKKWQNFVECISRPADRETERPIGAYLDAIRADVARDFPSVALQELLKETTDLLGDIDVASLSAAGNRADERPSQHLTELIESVRNRMLAGAGRREAALDSFADYIASLVAARCRQITEDSATQLTPAELKQVLRDFEDVYLRLDPKAAAERLGAEISGAADKRKDKIDPDDDLRGGS